MFLFNYSFDDILSFTFEFNKPENLFSDGFYGCCVVMCTLCTFIFLIWLREQIIRVGAPDWLERPLNFRVLQAIFRGEEIPPILGNNNNNNNVNNNNNNNNNNNADRANEPAAANNNAAAAAAGNDVAGANPEDHQNLPLDWRDDDEDNGTLSLCNQMYL